MTPVRVSTDDAVYRVRQVWLGPVGWTMPWHARYLAYGLFFPTFAALWGLFWVLGSHALLPVWPLCLAVLATTWTMQAVDHDLGLRAVATTVHHEIRGRRRHRPDPVRYTNTGVDVR